MFGWAFFLEFKMILSRCCKEIVYVHCVNDYGQYYVCLKCNKECDTIGLPWMGDLDDADIRSGIIY